MDFSLQTVHPDKAHREIMRSRALELRANGRSYRMIAADLGVSHETARVYVMGAIEDLTAQNMTDAHEARVLELARLDRLWEKAWDAIEANLGDATKLSALMNAAVRVSERRASLLGLDVTKVMPLIPPRGAYDNEADLQRLSVDELHMAEALMMKAQGLDPKPFGLLPESEVFVDEDPGDAGEPPPGAPQAPGA